MSTLPFIVGPLPFCVPLAAEGETGSGTSYPLEQTTLEDICRWIWRVRTWRCEITSLSNEFASYEDYAFEFTNHTKTGEPPLEAPLGVIAGYGLVLEHFYSVLDNLGDEYTFALRLVGLHTARRTEGPARFYPALSVELDLQLPENTPPVEIALRSALGTETAGTLEMEGISADLYSGFPGQITDTWQGNVILTALEEWDFSA